MPFTHDTRYAAGGSGANQPDEATAAYAGRWIDYGINVDIVNDRHGCAYIEAKDWSVLCADLNALGAFKIVPRDLERNTTVVQFLSPTVTVSYRRAGGYVYCDAWLVPTT